MNRKKILPITAAIALLFPLTACSTLRKHKVLTDVVRTEARDSTRVATDSLRAASTSVTSATLGAALSSALTATAERTEIDTSRTVTVTEYDTEGRPVRQTVTQHNGVVRQQTEAMSSEQWSEVRQTIDQQMTELYYWVHQEMDALREEQLLRDKSQELQAEPAQMPMGVRLMLYVEVPLLIIVLLLLSWFIARRKQN